MIQISLPASVLDRLAAHAAVAYPEECCGVLVGERLPASDAAPGTRAVVMKAVAAPNVAADRRRRYIIDPAVLLAAHKDARRERRRVVGYYHSHPDRPAEPSAFDLEHAWPGASYVIVTLAAGRPGRIRSYRLVDGRFMEETLMEETLIEETAREERRYEHHDSLPSSV